MGIRIITTQNATNSDVIINKLRALPYDVLLVFQETVSKAVFLHQAEDLKARLHSGRELQSIILIRHFYIAYDLSRECELNRIQIQLLLKGAKFFRKLDSSHSKKLNCRLYEIFVASEGRSNLGSGWLSVISDNTNTVVGNVNVAKANLVGIAYDSALGEVFASNVGDGMVSVISDSSLPFTTPGPKVSSSPSPTVPEFSFQILILVVVISAVFAATVARLKQLDK